MTQVTQGDGSFVQFLSPHQKQNATRSVGKQAIELSHGAFSLHVGGKPGE